MFDLFKKKLSSWVENSTKKVKEAMGIEEKPKKKIKKQKQEKKLEKKIEKKVEKKLIKQKTKKTAEELKEERKVTSHVLEDIKKEGIEITSPEQRYEETQEESKEFEEEVKEAEKSEEKEEKKGFFSRLFGKISKFTITEDYFDDIFSELELVLLENNVALSSVEFLKERLKKELIGKEIEKSRLGDEIKSSLKSSINQMLKDPFDIIKKIKEKDGTFVIVLFGINGSGKTTTIAKLANLIIKNKLSCVLAASDTFRAASIEQLQEHGRRLNLEVIKSQYNSDPASVAFDAIKHAQSKGIKVVLIDTAGRMHTKDSLMKEMEKIVKVSKPDLKIFIGESITGNDATEQAKVFSETIGIDGIILSKADVDEKSGTVLSVSHVTGKPILFLGVGQEYKDLELFDKKKILDSLGL